MVIYANKTTRCRCGRSMTLGQAAFWGMCRACVRPVMDEAMRVFERRCK